MREAAPHHGHQDDEADPHGELLTGQDTYQHRDQTHSTAFIKAEWCRHATAITAPSATALYGS